MDPADLTGDAMPLARPPRLRVYRPSTNGTGESDGSPDGPEVAPCLIDGMPYFVLTWTAKEWAQIPTDEQPGDAFPGSKGSWHRFAIDAHAQ
jgi:hypothetical protein